MTSAIPPPAQTQQHATNAPLAASGTTSPLPGAVPAQLPARSYANATKTASSAAPTPAGASAQNAKSTDTPVNGASPMAHGGSQPNGTTTNVDHGRKPSVVISASGASGSIPNGNGGPVGQANGSRPPIHFGAMNASPLPQHSMPYQSQTSSLPTPVHNPRVISPAHSPSPIPQPQASGGRPPAGLQSQTNGMTFGQLGGEGEQFRQTQTPLGPGMPSMHERRTSSQSMQSDMSNPNMQNMGPRFMPPPGGRGRGAGFAPQPYPGMSPSANYRQLPGQQGPRPNMPQQFQQAPGSPFMRSGSPAVNHQRPNMPSYGYSQPQQMPYQGFDPYGGYYQPYQSYQYQNQPPQSPRPPYPSPYNAPPSQMAPPFNPPEMSRSTSQTSQRPPSSLGQPHTPSIPNQVPSSQTPAPNQQSSQPSFIRPKKTSAIKITDAQGNEISFGKPSPSPSSATHPQPQAQPQAPVIVSTPNAPTPPPRAASGQHDRTESKSTRSSEETKNAFQEQVKRQIEEEKRKKQDAADAKSTAEQADNDAKLKAETAEKEAKLKAEQAKQTEKANAEAQSKAREEAEAAAQNKMKEDAEAAAQAEKAAAAKLAEDKEGQKSAATAEKAGEKDEEAAKEPEEETEEERMEREIAEMEAAEKEEEERERAFNEKRQKEKAEAAKRQSERDAKADEELKRQEREAEEREEAREREREEEKNKPAEEPDEENKDLFADLKKPALGPGASAPESGTETPVSEAAPDEDKTMPPPSQPAAAQQKAAGAQKPKPAHLKLETSKRVEPAEPTPGMQALKSARFLEIQEDAKYPDGFKSPNPALNQAAAKKGRAYDRDFLLQFQNVFKEKPSVDWDQKVKETLGPSDEPGSARGPGSARTPAARQVSGRPGMQPIPSFGGVMGQFGGQQRSLPQGTTSEQRFAASQQAAPRPGMAMPGQIGRAPSNLGMGPNLAMARNNSLQNMGAMGGPNSPRQPSGRGGKGPSKRGDRAMSKKEEADMMAKMPLTAHMEITPLEKSTTGWKPMSITTPAMGAAPAPDLSGNLPPDAVQRKVKAALNKMTPEKFDRISDQVLEIANQSKTEQDGRTLRQVIQLTFEKACDEAHWAGMYARFCHKMLLSMSPDIRDETIKDKNGQPVIGGALFRKYLLNRCQEEFERGWQANLPEKPEGEGESKEAALLSDEYYVAAAAKRRGLGLIQFIGQLYKLKMLTLRIMHECVMRLLNFEGPPDEAAVENLTTLMRAVGPTMAEDPQGENLIQQYFDRVDSALLKSDALASRSRFMIMDLVDLRKAGWRGKDDTKGPKTIDQIHQEAAAAQAKAADERAKMNTRGGPRPPPGRGDARNFSGGGMPPPVDFNRTTNIDDLRRLQNRGTGAAQRAAGGGLGPGGSLGPSALSGRGGSRRGNLGPPSSGNTTRTNTPPVDKEKKDDTPTQTNAFSALAALDPSGEDAASQSGEAASPPTARDRSKSPMPAQTGDAS